MHTTDYETKNPGQLSFDLPGVTTYLTGHDEKTGKAIIKSTREGNWSQIATNLAFYVPYTTSEFPVSLNNDKDIIANDELIASQKLGLTITNGTVCRMVDMGPDSSHSLPPPRPHRTQSLDYGVVLEGSVELLLDSGEKVLMHRGDVAVQRGTLHAWTNPSKTKWARMLFVLVYSQKVVVAGNTLQEVLPQK